MGSTIEVNPAMSQSGRIVSRDAERCGYVGDKKTAMLLQRIDEYESIDASREPDSGDQILCPCDIGPSDLASSSDDLAQSESYVSLHTRLGSCRLWQDHPALDLDASTAT